jgi:small multidrug resistance family-3 protein
VATPAAIGTAQHATQAAPRPKAIFQCFISGLTSARASCPPEYGKTSSYLRSKRILTVRKALAPISTSHNRPDMDLLKTFALFAATAVAEIVGCYLPYLWLKEGRSIWLLVPAGLSLAVFAYLLTLHPTAAGRVYAAYGGVYVAVAIAWLWAVDKVQPTVTDWVGVSVCLLGMAIIMVGTRQSS